MSTTTTIFSPELAARFDKLVTVYPWQRSALVPMLLYAQDEVGYLSDAVIAEIAERLELTELDVRNVLSYYSMLRTKPPASINVQVCTNISCMLRGGYEILDHCSKRSASAIRRRRRTACSRWKRWNASEPAAGRRRSRSTTTSTRTSHRRRSTRSSRLYAAKAQEQKGR